MMFGMLQLVKTSGGLRTSGRRPGEASWWLVVGLFVLFMVALVSAPSLPAWGAVLTMAGAFGMLSVAGLLWGADSRDGSDWKPRKPESLR
jgi:hypothetical protein